MDRADTRRGSAKIGSDSGASRAVTQLVYGPPDMLELGTIPTPAPGQGELLLRVLAASINARDWHVMRGEPRLARLLDRHSFGVRGPVSQSVALTSPALSRPSARA